MEMDAHKGIRDRGWDLHNPNQNAGGGWFLHNLDQSSHRLGEWRMGSTKLKPRFERTWG